VLARQSIRRNRDLFSLIRLTDQLVA